MLNLKKIVGIIAMIAIVGFAFFSCEEETGGPTPGLMGTPSVKDAPAYDSPFAGDIKDAEKLFSDLKSKIGYFDITDAIQDAQDFALKEKGLYGKQTYELYSLITKDGYSDKIEVNDTTLFTKALGVEGATVKETTNFSIKFKGEYGGAYNVGDSATAKGSMDRTVSIPKIVEKEVSDGYGYVNGDFKEKFKTLKFGGTVKVNESSSNTGKVKEVEPEFKGEKSSNGTSKYAATVTYDNGEFGAIFRFSCSEGSSSYSRKSGSESGYVMSDIEVFNKDGEKKHTFSSNAGNFFDVFSDNDVKNAFFGYVNYMFSSGSSSSNW